MIGIRMGTAANASLLGNFEIVATTLIALLVFHEAVSGKLWLAIGFITVSSIILSFDGRGSFQFSVGSLFVLLATACWGLENNCTRKISDKSTYEIVVLKGLFSGGGAVLIAFVLNGERLTLTYFIALMFMVVGSIFVAYDTMVRRHRHSHVHTITHTHDGSTHTHEIMHEHEHNHFAETGKHRHHHKDYMESEEHRAVHARGL